MISPPPNSSEEFVQNVLACLQQTYGNTNNAKRKQYEETLSLYHSSVINHLPTILNVVSSQQISPELTQSLLIFTLDSIKKNNSTLNKPNLMSLLQIIYSNLIGKQIPDKYIAYLNKIFEELINNEIVEENISIINDISNHIEKSVLSNAISHKNYKSVSYLCEDILCSTSLNTKNCVPILVSQLRCCEYMLKIILELFNNNINANEIDFYLNTVKSIFSLLLNLSVHSKKTYKVFEQFSTFFFDNILPFAIKLLEINHNEEVSIKMKTKIMRFIISLLSSIPKIFTKENPLYSKFELITKYCVYILQVSNTNNIIVNIKNETKYYDIFVGQIIWYLTQIFLKYPKTNDNEIISYSCNITKNIFMPMLISQEKDIENMYNDQKGSNYANYIYDIIKTQKAKDYKVYISKFITKIAKKHFEFANHMIEYAFKLIEISIKGTNKANQNINDYMIVSQNVNDVHRIESSLLMLCIFYKVVHNDSTIVSKLVSFVYDCISVLNAKLNEYLIIKQRLCLFISVYIEDFLLSDNDNNNNQILSTIFEFLFENTFNNDSIQYKVGIYESFQALKSIVKSTKHEIHIDEMLNKHYQRLINEILTSENENYFEIFGEITTSLCLNSNAQRCLEILNNCVTRILNESKLKQNNKTTNHNANIFISYCYNIITLVINTNKKKFNFLNENIIHVEQILQPLFTNEISSSKNIFWEDLIILSNNLIQQCNFIPKVIFLLFPFLQKYLKQCKEMDLCLFELLSLCLASDNNSDLDKDHSYERIFHSLFNNSLQMSSSDDLSKYRAIYFMEIWVTRKNNINLEIISKILETSKKQLSIMYKQMNKIVINEGEITKTHLALFVSFVSLQLLMFYNYPIVAFNHISFNDILDYLNFLIDYEIIVVSHVRMLIIGICNVIVNNSIIENYSRMIPHLITITYHFLKKLKYFERKKLKHKDEKHFKENIINSDDESSESEEEEDDKESEEKETSQNEDDDNDFSKDKLNDYNEIENRAIIMFQTIDEFKTFKETVEIIKNKYTPIYNSWYDDFSELNDIQKFNDILFTTRIKIQKDNTVIDIPRKILKIKRSNINNNNDTEMSMTTHK